MVGTLDIAYGVISVTGAFDRKSVEFKRISKGSGFCGCRTGVSGSGRRNTEHGGGRGDIVDMGTSFRS